MTTTPPKAITFRLRRLCRLGTGFATAHINKGAWQREPASYRVVTVGESREPVTSMSGMRVTPEANI
jgi:hypothetical protein